MAQPKSRAAQKVGERIAHLRHRAGLSASRLADYADLDLTHVQRLERGWGNPTLYTLVHIAIALEIDPGELIRDIEAGDLPSGRRPLGHTTGGGVSDVS